MLAPGQGYELPSDGTHWYFIQLFGNAGKAQSMGRDQLIDLAAGLLDQITKTEEPPDPNFLNSTLDFERYNIPTNAIEQVKAGSWDFERDHDPRRQHSRLRQGRSDLLRREFALDEKIWVSSYIFMVPGTSERNR